MIGLVGTSFKLAPVQIREKFAFSANEVQIFSNELLSSFSEAGLVILTTCNRTEIYFSCPNMKGENEFSEIIRILTKLKAYAPEMQEYFYFYKDQEVVKHLYKVVSGIDSLIIGEDQIMGQVKDAFYLAEELKTPDKYLTRLFLKAFETGKKVRTQTKINEGSGSASSAAVDVAIREFPNIKSAKILMVGAGKTGELVLTNLHKRSIQNLFVANRTVSKAEELAQRFNGMALALGQIHQTLASIDIIFVATDAQQALISVEEIKNAALNRHEKQIYIDLSVPRNLPVDANDIEGVQLYSIDDLQAIVESTNKKRQSAIGCAMKLINKMIDEYMEWMLLQDIVPMIQKIKQDFHQINETELKGFIRIKSINDSSIVAEYAKHITEKFARLLIKNMRDLTQDADNKQLVKLANQLFDFSK